MKDKDVPVAGFGQIRLTLVGKQFEVSTVNLVDRRKVSPETALRDTLWSNTQDYETAIRYRWELWIVAQASTKEEALKKHEEAIALIQTKPPFDVYERLHDEMEENTRSELLNKILADRS